MGTNLGGALLEQYNETEIPMKKIVVRKVARVRLTSTVTSNDGCSCIVNGA